MEIPDEHDAVEVNINRVKDSEKDGEEIQICFTIPRIGSRAKQKLTLTVSLADFALALTGRGGITGELEAFQFGESHPRNRK